MGIAILLSNTVVLTQGSTVIVKNEVPKPQVWRQPQKTTSFHVTTVEGAWRGGQRCLRLDQLRSSG